MRLSTALFELCCMKRVISPWLIPNCCQLIIAPGVLVILSVLLVGWLNVTVPRTTDAPPGLACVSFTTEKMRQILQANKLSFLVIRIILLHFAFYTYDVKSTF